MSVVRIVAGGGATEDRAGELAEAIKAICYERYAGMSLAAIIGAIEIAKTELMRDHQ